MAEAQHAIQINIDSSRAQAGLRALSQSIRETSRDLQSLGSANSGGNFAALSRNLSSLGSGFESLRRQTSQDSGLSNLSREISMLSRGMPVAAREIVALASSFVVSRNAVALFAGALGSVGIGKFAADSLTAGTAALNLKIAVDSVASSGGEAGRALRFIRQTAQDLGQPLDVATKQFASFYTSARALGKTPETIEKVWRGLSTAMSALHVSRQDQATFMRELQETYSMGKIDATRLIRSMSTHLPGLSASMQQALGISGAKMHEMFKNGGLPIDSWEKLADLLEKRYGSGVATALNHAQGAVISLSNSFELLKQKSFETGIDSAIAGLANTINSILKPNIDSLAETFGTAFRYGSAGAQLLIQKLYDLREPIGNVATALAGYAAASIGLRLAAGAVALLLSPLGAAAALAALLSSQWDSLTSVFSGSDAAFNAGAERIKKLTNGWIDLHKAIKGAVEIYTLAEGLLSGKSLAESKSLAATAGADFDAGELGKHKGQDFTQGFLDRASNLFGKLTATMQDKLPSFGLKSLSEDYKRLLDATAPKPFESHGDYAANAELYGKPNLDLSEDLKKTYERLLPTNKALETYRATLAEIAKMRGKLDPLSGKPIGDAEIQKLTTTARETALKDAFPAANKISELMDKVRLESEALQNLGGNTSKEALSQEREFLRIKVDLLKHHVQLRTDDEQALRSLITAEHELAKGGDNGFSRWANEQKSGMEAINGSIGHGLDTVADGLAKIATTGKDIKATFRDMLRSIASDLIRQGIRSMMAEGLKNLNLGSIFGTGMNDSIAKALGLGQGVIDKANGALDDAAKALGQTATPLMEVQAGVVNILGGSLGATNGGIGGGSGLAAFKPGSDIKSAINPTGVGGVLPKNDNTSPLFSNPLPDFKGGAKVGGLIGIPANSASIFGKGLVPSLGKLPEFGAKVASQTSAEITKNSVAEFGKLINIQKPLTATQSVSAAGLRAPTAAEELSSLGRTGGSRSWRNSNPGNIEYGPFAKAHGAIGTDGRFAKFPNDAVGTKAQEALLFDSKGYKNLTLGQAIHRWAPASENNVPAYIKAMGADPGTKMRDFSPAQRQTLLQNMRQHEGWKPGRVIGGKQAGIDKLGADASRLDLNPTGSISKLADQSKRASQEIEKQLQAETKLAAEMTKSTQSITQAAPSLTSFDGGLSKMTQQLTAGVPVTESFRAGPGKSDSEISGFSA